MNSTLAVAVRELEYISGLAIRAKTGGKLFYVRGQGGKQLKSVGCVRLEAWIMINAGKCDLSNSRGRPAVKCETYNKEHILLKSNVIPCRGCKVCRLKLNALARFKETKMEEPNTSDVKILSLASGGL